ncbi:MAG: polysaccharide deacetylase family protein [Firmicutes bacterium]|nr:polysaccharide deacetylase family protein [Bacillota bacterium]
MLAYGQKIRGPLLGGILLGLLMWWPAEGSAAPAAVPGVVVLTLHEVAPGEPDNPYVLSPGEFRELVEGVLRLGYRFVDLETLHAFLEGGRTVPAGAVLLTFDDGYRGVYDYAHPVLVEYRVPAVVFPVMKWFTPFPRPEPHREHLTAAQVRTMLASGLWAFGGHSFDGHRHIPGAGPYLTTRLPGEAHEDYLARVRTDVDLMTRGLLELGVPPLDFAAPYGAVNDDLRAVLREAGYRYLYLCGEGPVPNRPGNREIHRLTVTDVPRTLRVLRDLLPLPPAE